MDWQKHSSVEMITISYQLKYNPRKHGFTILKPDDRYLHSLLTWKPNADTIDFSLIDMKVTNLKTGVSQKCK